MKPYKKNILSVFFTFIFLISIFNYNANAYPINDENITNFYDYDYTNSDISAYDYNGSNDIYLYNALKINNIMNNSVYFSSDKTSYGRSDDRMDFQKDNFTLSFWVNISAVGNTYESMIIEMNEISSNLVFQVRIQKDYDIVVAYWDTTGAYHSTTSTNKITLNEWYYFSLTYEKNNDLILYVNGQKFNQLSSVNISETPTYLTMSFFHVNYAYLDSTAMYMDELTIQNNTLTQTEIIENMNVYRSIFYIDEAEFTINKIISEMSFTEYIVSFMIVFSLIGGAIGLNDNRHD